MNDRDEHFMRQALELARRGVEQGHGGPFGAVVVIDDRIVGEGWNRVVQLNDPTAHAEIIAIRSACEASDAFHLLNATLYTTCEPCPMCMGAIYWARIGRLIFGATARDANDIGFSDQWIKDELRKPLENQRIQIGQRLESECKHLLQAWWQREDRVDY